MRPDPKTRVPEFKDGDTTRDVEDAALICAAENDALRLQVNSILDKLDGHIGLPDAPPVQEKPEPPAEDERGFMGWIF